MYDPFPACYFFKIYAVKSERNSEIISLFIKLIIYLQKSIKCQVQESTAFLQARKLVQLNGSFHYLIQCKPNVP